jgi:hypothetical protein
VNFTSKTTPWWPKSAPGAVPREFLLRRVCASLIKECFLGLGAFLLPSQALPLGCSRLALAEYECCVLHFSLKAGSKQRRNGAVCTAARRTLREKIKSDCEDESRKNSYIQACARTRKHTQRGALLFTARPASFYNLEISPSASVKTKEETRSRRKGVSGGRRASASRVAQILCRRTTKRHWHAIRPAR